MKTKVNPKDVPSWVTHIAKELEAADEFVKMYNEGLIAFKYQGGL